MSVQYPETGPSLVAKAREKFLATGAVPSGMLPSIIESSWQRCLQYGLDCHRGDPFEPSPRDQLELQQEKSHHLLNHAKPVMDVLFEQIVDTQNVIILACNSGLILHSKGDPDFLQRAERVALRPGVEWSEGSRGTNAIGTAIATSAPVVVHGNQHYLQANHFLTCSASPIYDPHGGLAGILDVTGDHRRFNQHTMGLVRMSVQMIENRMFAAHFKSDLLLRFHARSDFVGTMCEGLAAFDESGALLSVNRNACLLFDQSLDKLQGSTFTSLFGQPVTRMFDHLLVRPQDPLMLTLRNGIKIHVKADYDPLKLRRSPRLAPARVETDSTHAPQLTRNNCPLSRLETGDGKITALLAKVRKIQGRDIPILIQGETGTGKELLANAIHSAGPRADKPFVAVNCAAIPEGLIESELFGYEEGAFTGANRKGNIGRILQANGGTLFLDEIGDMAMSLQARLLRVLQEREVVPLSSAKSYPVDIAVICATHRRIRDLVSAGEFREDLYYRLNGLTVILPPLRERSDLDSLITAMLTEHGGSQPPQLDAEVRRLMHLHPWPGNLRQLSNLLRTAVAMAEGEDTIACHHLPDDFLEDISCHSASGKPPTVATLAAVSPPPLTDKPQAESAPANTEAASGRLKDLATQAIQDAIARNNGNISAAARELGVSRNTLYRKMHG